MRNLCSMVQAMLMTVIVTIFIVTIFSTVEIVVLAIVMTVMMIVVVVGNMLVIIGNDHINDHDDVNGEFENPNFRVKDLSCDLSKLLRERH